MDNLLLSFNNLANETIKTFEPFPNSTIVKAQIELIMNTLQSGRISIFDALVMLASVIDKNDF